MIINQKKCNLESSKLQQDGSLRISNFLHPEFAKQIYKCLSNEVDWGLACNIGGKNKIYLNCSDVNELSLEDQEKLQSQKNQSYEFIYNTYMIVTSYIEQRDPGHFFYKMLEWINSVESIGYFRSLIKDDSLVKMSAQATRYLPGHFLTQHNDENAEESRMYAYVLGFSKDWNPDWGGLLNILDENGKITKTLIPEYNSLSIFKVPQNHFVSLVSPLAKNERIAITGWLQSQ